MTFKNPVGLLKYPFLLFIMFVWSCTSDKPEIVHHFQPDDNTSIVLIGNTFAERMQHYNYFETLLHKSFPGKNLTVRNMGWSADEINKRSRPLNFPTQDELLSEYKADYIMAFYGINEAFKGADSVDRFKEQLVSYLQHLKSVQYNGNTSPQLILVSPITHEKLGGLFPDPTVSNKNIERYTKTMKQVAKDMDIPFIDLFHASQKWYDPKKPLTINGIHLTAEGYRKAGEYMAGSLGFSENKWVPEFTDLKKLIDQKNQQFFYLYRAINSEYIVGRRKEPWVQPAGGPVSYPGEFAKLQKMVIQMDSVVWSQSNSSSPDNLQKAHAILFDEVQASEFDKAPRQKPTTASFTLPEGFEINLFASEVDFSLTNPVKITFDPQGRLWVADMPSYPQYLPGAMPNDKVLILEDTDHDGVADKETIFADSLYMPNSIELGKGGVYISQPPNIWFMKDTNGDGIADEKEIILHGFGTEDVHHTLDTYMWGPDGALYWHTGTFLHSQIETPHGPRRSDYGATWRFEPETQKLEPYVSYPYANPWGHVFLRDGTEIISDVSTGMNYFAPPMTAAIDYPYKHGNMRDFVTSASKPKTCGTEIISSRHFPEEWQGNVLFNTFVGTQGIKQHRIHENGSGIIAEEILPLLQSSDPHFRPVDLQFGPDGALYVVDWYNPIINHGERALRDPLRDHTHGRIWRITYKHKEPLKPVDLTQLGVDQLLDQLKEYEDRVRYRAKTQLRQMEPEAIIPALEKWVSALDKSDPLYDQHRLEGLWMYQQLHHPEPQLLDELLKSKDEYIRTAATRVLFYWRDHLKSTESKLIALSKDQSMKVRLQAIISLSHFKTENAVNALLDAALLPKDYYIDYTLTETFRNLKPVWWQLFKKDNSYLADQPQKAALLLGSLADENALKVSVFIREDPKWPMYGWKALTDNDYDELKGHPAVDFFRNEWKTSLDKKSDPVQTMTVEEIGKLRISESDCFACHTEKEKLVGPPYREIAKKYSGADIPKLTKKILEGGSGVWGDIPMTPHQGMEIKDVEAMVSYILSLK